MYYHYCSVETFENIINSKVLWLSDLTESNDTQEVTRTFDTLWQRVKIKLLASDLDRDVVEKEIEILDRQFEIEIQIDKPFGICFCHEADVLQQWLEYGDKTRGVALGFDLGWFKGLEKKMPHPSSIFLNAIGYDEVLYHDLRLEEDFYRLCYDAIKQYGYSAWIMGIRPTFKHYSAFIKNPTFHGEYETRIVYYPNSFQGFDKNNSLNISDIVDSPFKHYCLPWSSQKGDSALKSIWLGCNCVLTSEDVYTILNNGDLSGEFQLFRSECSYRLK